MFKFLRASALYERRFRHGGGGCLKASITFRQLLFRVPKVIMKTRKFLITINNPLDHGFDDEKIKSILISDKTIYLCMCHEIGEEGTPHIHIFVIFENPRDFNSMINKFNNKAHIDLVKGSNQECRDYVRKEGKYLNSEKKTTNLIETFFEHNELPPSNQGKRNDNELILELIKDGNTPKEIINEYPQFSMRLPGIQKLYDLYRWDDYKIKNRDDIQVTFIYGETGTGKTSYVFNAYGRENVYQVTDYLHPFDNYEGEKIILFDEFRDDIECKEMLKYLDRYPVTLPCRYNNKWACYTEVFIVSNIAFPEIYKCVDIETLKAFRRRVHNVIHMKDERMDYLKYKFGNNKNTFLDVDVIKSVFKKGEVINIEKD